MNINKKLTMTWPLIITNDRLTSVSPSPCRNTECCPPGIRHLSSNSAKASIERLSTWVLALAQRLNAARLNGIVETVPTFRSLMIYYDPLALSAAALTARIVELMRGLETRGVAGRLWRLPACYDPQVALDLDETAARTGLTPAQLIERHSAVTYHVYMLGFLPGCAYLGDLPAELALPRRQVAAAAGSGRLAGHRDDDHLHLSDRDAVRLAHHRPLAGAAVAAAAGRPVRCSRPATR